MNLTLQDIVLDPQMFTYPIEMRSSGQALLRPLQVDDVDQLALLLEGFSASTRWFSFFPSYDRACAQELCEAINRYDKLRFVVEVLPAGEIVGLFEFSFAIPNGDLQRFAEYGVPLDENFDCRFGPVLADAYQNSGLGSRVFPYLVDVVKRFGKHRIILWGGVLADNSRAIRFYEKQGFRRVGSFVSFDGIDSLDMIMELGELPSP